MMSPNPHILGIHTRYVDERPISIDQMARFQHAYCLGQTGTGKSTLARQSFLQDAVNGHGGCYFDFHGEDATWLLDHIPQERLDDVIYFNPLDQDHAIGYNPLDGIRPENFATFTDEIVASLRHVHQASWGARMDDILTNAIRPLFDLPDESKGTLLGTVRMLNDDFYRRWVVNQCPEQTVKDFWFNEYGNWSKNDKAHNLNSSLNKIRRFQSSPILRRILGQQRSRIDFGRAIANGQLIIFDINKWKMGAVNANTLASLILSRLIYEGTHRSVYPRNCPNSFEPIPFHIVIDEFQSVTSLAIIEALAGIRKHSVGIMLCHQHTDQIAPEVLAAVKGNIGTKIIFRVGGDDAKRLFETMEVTEPKHLATQSDHEFVLQYKTGNTMATVRAKSLLIDFPKTDYRNAIQARMRAKFARPVAEVEAKYARWMQSRHYGGPPKVTPKEKRSGKMRPIGAIMLDR